MKKLSGAKGFNRSVLQKKVRFVGMTVLELSIIFLVVCGGVTAIFASRQQSPTTTSSEPNTLTGQPAAQTQDTTQPGTSTPAQQNTATSNNSSTSCSTTDLPFETEYKNVDWLDKGKTHVSPGGEGRNGKEKVCVNSSGQVVSRTQTAPKSNKIVYVGTKEYPQEDPSPQYTYEQALSLATQTCQSKGYYPDSTDMTNCKNSEMNKYGY